MNVLTRVIFVVGITSILSGLLFLLLPWSEASADGLSWVSDSTISVEVGDQANGIPEDRIGFNNCVTENHMIDGYGMLQLCITKGKTFDYAISSFTGSMTGGGKSFVRFPGDRFFYRLTGLPIAAGNIALLPNTDMLIGLEDRFWYGEYYKLHIIKDAPTRFTRQIVDLRTEYRVDPDINSVLGVQYSGNSWHIAGVGYSSNYRWLVVAVRDLGLVRIDTETFSVERFAPFDTYHLPRYLPTTLSLAISDDGAYAGVAASGHHIPLQIYSIGSECTRVVQIPTADLGAIQASCPAKNLRDIIKSYIGEYSYERNIAFQDNGGKIRLYALDTSANTGKWILLQAPGYISPPPLDYLALGDSYSSGEGDTEKVAGKKHYRSYTDNEEDKSANQPREKCHVSTRSYPYILAEGMNLGEPKNDATTKWQTVACSGAQKYDVTNADSNYSGQGKGGSEGGKPRLQGYNAKELQATALNEFIPGREKQIEFVKKYKPKVITLTMGGNDIGFGDKVKACVSMPTVCNHATTQRVSLASQIDKQYERLSSFYEELYEASGKQAKIYILGYPQFINGSLDAFCPTNIGLLNNIEREMIREGVTYLNDVIAQAAAAAGVRYIDIEDSLEGHRLCDEGDKYVTAVVGFPIKMNNDQQESFHPNAKGHFEIAMSLWGNVNNESLLDYDICSDGSNNCPDMAATKDKIDVPSFFQTAKPQENVHYKHMTSGEQIKSTMMNILLTPYTLAQNSFVNVVINSDPVNLGDYEVSSDGSLNLSIEIPQSVPAGYHTLTVTGQTFSGEPIQYEQVILVFGSDPEDLDENNVPDSEQPCGPFIIPSGIDEDQDGIDDACDSEMSDTPQEEPEPTPVEPTDPTDPAPMPNPEPEQPTNSSPITSILTVIITHIVTTIVNVIKSFLGLFG